MPMAPETIAAVTIPAPALSAVVIGAYLGRYSSGLSVFEPALGSLLLSPPVVEVSGFAFFLSTNLSRMALKTLLALICASIPGLPSKPLYQRMPHTFWPLPVHDLAAPSADFWSLGKIWSSRSGINNATVASHCAVMPLNKMLFLLQFSLISHSQSERAKSVDFMANFWNRAPINPFTASSHCLSLVY